MGRKPRFEIKPGIRNDTGLFYVKENHLRKPTTYIRVRIKIIKMLLIRFYKTLSVTYPNNKNTDIYGDRNRTNYT